MVRTTVDCSCLVSHGKGTSGLRCESHGHGRKKATLSVCRQQDEQRSPVFCPSNHSNSSPCGFRGSAATSHDVLLRSRQTRVMIRRDATPLLLSETMTQSHSRILNCCAQRLLSFQMAHVCQNVLSTLSVGQTAKRPVTQTRHTETNSQFPFFSAQSHTDTHSERIVV